MCGLICYAYSVSVMLRDPAQPLSVSDQLAFSLGIFLFLSGSVLAYRRARGTWLTIRMSVAAGLFAAMVFLPGLSGGAEMLLAFGGLVALAAWEERWFAHRDAHVTEQ